MSKKPVVIPDNATVPMAFVFLLYDRLVAEGLPAASILGAPRPPKGARPLEPFPAAQFLESLHRASEHWAGSLLGLRLGQRFDITCFGALGNVLETSDCLADALQRIQRFVHLVHETNDMNIHMRGGIMIVEWPEANGRYGPLYDEMGVAAFVHCFRELTGTDAAFPQIEFDNERPVDITAYESYFGGTVLFGQSATRVHIPASYLGMPFKSRNKILCNLLETEVRRQHTQHDQWRSIESALRRAIARRAYFGLPGLEEAAEELECSVRQLREQLKRQGKSFRLIRNEVIGILAKIHLANAQLDVADVATLLGYSEQSAFTRAFRSWTGKSPKAYRASAR